MAYPLTKLAVRAKLRAMCALAPEAEEWVPFMRDVIRLPGWMLPAVQEAVRQDASRQEGGDTGADPLERIRHSVRRLAIEMRLSKDPLR